MDAHFSTSESLEIPGVLNTRSHFPLPVAPLGPSGFQSTFGPARCSVGDDDPDF
jgi:hypothetical protein